METLDSTNLQQRRRLSPGERVTVRELSTELRSKWIERVFAKLLSIYGDGFASNWAHTNIDEVKATWADALGGFDADAIGNALKDCYDEEYCPKLPKFVALCRKHVIRPIALQDVTPIPAPQAAALIAEAHKRAGISPRPGKYDFKLWAKKLRTDYQDAIFLQPIQIRMASEALGEIWDNGLCKLKGVAA